MKIKLFALLKLLSLFGVKFSNTIKAILFITILTITLFNFQVNIKKSDYGYLNTDTTTTDTIYIEKYRDLLLVTPTDSIKLDSIKER